MLNQQCLLLLSSILPPAPTDMDENRLARRAAQDPDAFADIYERHLPMIYRYHLIRTGNVQDAQDLAAQTFLTALESISSYRGLGSFAAWLFGIARHKLADHHRRKRPEIHLDAGEEAASQDPLPEEIVLQRLDFDRVVNALQAIAPERAEALGLRIFGSLSTIEVAQAMNRSVPAVKMLISRGLNDLYERIAIQHEVKP
jgi:RNA polymerase sigma-70 factor (ECF subfamily)